MLINSYREIFRIPGSKAFSTAGLIGRMPMSMAGIGIITMVAHFRGAYAVAGATAAAFAFSVAVCGPQVARLVDRYGQRKVLPVAATISALALLALLLLAREGAPAWSLLMCAALAGCTPSMSAMVRARWTRLCPDKGKLRTAYAFESVLDEVSFIGGAPLSIGLSLGWFPEAGVLTALLLQLIGVGALVSLRRTEPPIQAPSPHDSRSLLGIPGMQILLLLLLAMGAIVGAIDVVSMAFAAQQGQPAAASIVLAIYAIGSCFSGLLFGTLKLAMPLPKQLLYCGLATAAATLPLLFVGNIASLSVAMCVAGLFFSPTMIVAMAAVESIVPGAKLTEGFSWLVSGLGAGVAVGAGVTGQIVDLYGVRGGFAVTLAAGTATMLVVVLGHHLLLSRGATLEER